MVSRILPHIVYAINGSYLLWALLTPLTSPFFVLFAALAFASSRDHILFARVLKWIPYGTSWQYAPDAARIADAAEPRSDAFVKQHEAAHSEYRWNRTMSSLALFGVAYLAAGPVAFAALVVAIWCGVHDELYYVWGGQAPPVWNYPRYWMWWTPPGLVYRFILRRPVPAYWTWISAAVGLIASILIIVHFA